MIFPTIKGQTNHQIHAIKNTKQTECGFPYADFFETKTSLKKNIKFRSIEKITCMVCRRYIKELIINIPKD
jgi:hypothetical protein